MKTQEQLLALALPKWPQMLVTGKRVSQEQAKDIIFRTDSFLTDASQYGGGNNHAFNKWYRDEAGFGAIGDDYKRGWELMSAVRDQLGYVDTDYVRNDWASCSFVFGPHGWCSPLGEIFFVDNVGKWPEVKEIFSEWELIAKAFPYLELNVTLMSGESGEEDSQPVVNIAVSAGQAKLLEADMSVHGAKADLTRSWDNFSIGSVSREIGLPTEWYEEFAGKVRAAVEAISEQRTEVGGHAKPSL